MLSGFGAIYQTGRVVRDGNLITAGGVTSGIDFALAIVAELFGQRAAEIIQLSLEYAPAPPFDAGTPGAAGPDCVKEAQSRMAQSRAEREDFLRRRGAQIGAIR